MSAEWLTALGAIAQPIIARISSGKAVKNQERMFVLLYSMAEDSRETKDEMKKLREDFKRFNDSLHELTKSISNLTKETAYLMGQINAFIKGKDK